MRKLLIGTFVTVVLFSGCHISDYEHICDSEGNPLVIPAGQVYIKPPMTVWTILADGCCAPVTYLHQLPSAEQHLDTEAIQVPCDSVPELFECPALDRHSDAANNANPCLGAPTVPSVTIPQCVLLYGAWCSPRLGECERTGGSWVPGGETTPCLDCDPCVPELTFVEIAELLASLVTMPRTTVLGQTVIQVPVESVTLTSPDGTIGQVPLSGGVKIYVRGPLDDLLLIVDIREARQELLWLADWVERHGEHATTTVTIGSWTKSLPVNIASENIPAFLERL